MCLAMAVEVLEVVEEEDVAGDGFVSDWEGERSEEVGKWDEDAG